MTPRDLVAAQAKDPALWYDAPTASEAYLQRALRELHAAVEVPRHALMLATPPAPPRELLSVPFDVTSDELREAGFHDVADRVEGRPAASTRVVGLMIEEIERLHAAVESTEENIRAISEAIYGPGLRAPVVVDRCLAAIRARAGLP